MSYFKPFVDNISFFLFSCFASQEPAIRYLSDVLKPIFKILLIAAEGPCHSSLGRDFYLWSVISMGQLACVSGLAFLCISFLNPQSQSYSLSESSHQLPKGDSQPSAAVQPLSHPSGHGQPEAQQPVSTYFPSKS